MTIRFEHEGQKYIAQFSHTTMCSIRQETKGTPDSICNYGKSQCHDVDDFDKNIGESKAMSRALRDWGCPREHRKRLMEQLKARQAKRGNI